MPINLIGININVKNARMTYIMKRRKYIFKKVFLYDSFKKLNKYIFQAYNN